MAASRPGGVRERFNALADRLTTASGSLPALIGSIVLVLAWAVTGPVFNFSDTWQLVINTSTTVVTFWMVFVIQNSANRQARATQLKLDELLRAHSDARTEFVTLDHASEEDLSAHEREFARIAEVEDRRVADATAPADVLARWPAVRQPVMPPVPAEPARAPAGLQQRWRRRR